MAWMRATSNVAFAGPDLDRLYVPGGEPGALFRLDLGVKGLKILPPPAKCRRGVPGQFVS